MLLCFCQMLIQIQLFIVHVSGGGGSGRARALTPFIPATFHPCDLGNSEISILEQL